MNRWERQFAREKRPEQQHAARVAIGQKLCASDQTLTAANVVWCSQP